MLGSVKLVSHFSSVSTKVIVRGNMMKPTKCYSFHKQKHTKRHQKNCTQPARTEIVGTTSHVEDTFVDNSQQQITSRFE